MKNFRLNETGLRRVIEESIKKVLNEYNLTDADELMEYLWLRPDVTGLNVDVFVDDGGSYERNGHDLILFARNGYNKSVSEFIPFLVGGGATVLDSKMPFHITYDDVFDIQDFICDNLDILKALSDQKISQRTFVSRLKMRRTLVAEGKTLIAEMATLRMKDSNLPMDVWLDEGATFQGHAPRLKFRASHEQRTTREYSSMLLTNPPTIENMPKDSQIGRAHV